LPDGIADYTKATGKGRDPSSLDFEPDLPVIVIGDIDEKAASLDFHGKPFA
jgi:hypothetical protein